LKSIEHLGLNRIEIAQKLSKVFAQQIFLNGFVHADPHPGNIFVRKRNTHVHNGHKHEGFELVLLGMIYSCLFVFHSCLFIFRQRIVSTLYR